jgi:hypothetical protein
MLRNEIPLSSVRGSIYQHSHSGARPSERFRRGCRTNASYSDFMHDRMQTQAARFIQ